MPKRHRQAVWLQAQTSFINLAHTTHELPNHSGSMSSYQGDRNTCISEHASGEVCLAGHLEQNPIQSPVAKTAPIQRELFWPGTHHAVTRNQPFGHHPGRRHRVHDGGPALESPYTGPISCQSAAMWCGGGTKDTSIGHTGYGTRVYPPTSLVVQVRARETGQSTLGTNCPRDCMGTAACFMLCN